MAQTPQSSPRRNRPRRGNRHGAGCPAGGEHSWPHWVRRSQLRLIYLVLREKYARNPFNGEGAYRYGGRWSSAGVRLNYASEHPSISIRTIHPMISCWRSLKFPIIWLLNASKSVRSRETGPIPQLLRNSRAWATSSRSGEKVVCCLYHPFRHPPDTIACSIRTNPISTESSYGNRSR
jgi:RES domain